MSNIEKTGALSPSLPQPKAMYLMVAVQMWESFSYYGMRAILVLYMISMLHFEDAKSYSIYALYVALVEGLGVFGGKLADKYIGIKNAIYLGGFVIAIGHVILSLSFGTDVLYLGLALIAIGTGLFSTNCTVLLGEFYKKEDPRRDAGYVYYYVGLNLGAVLATISCAYAAEVYGWHAGFALAAFGMFIGLLILLKFNKLLEDKGRRPANVSKSQVSTVYLGILVSVPIVSAMLYFYEVGIVILTAAIFAIILNVLYSTKSMPAKERSNICSILLVVMLMAMFYGFEEQVGSSLVVFAQRYSDLTLFGFTIPAASINTINPLVILILGPILGCLIEFYEAKTKKLVNIFSKIALAFLLQSIAFAGLYLSTLGISNDAKVSGYIVGYAFAIIAISELFIGPVAFAHCASVAPQSMKGVMMGIIMLGFSLANLFSGVISKFMAISDENADYGISVYGNCFKQIVLACIMVSALIYVIQFIKLARRNRRNV